MEETGFKKIIFFQSFLDTYTKAGGVHLMLPAQAFRTAPSWLESLKHTTIHSVIIIFCSRLFSANQQCS